MITREEFLKALDIVNNYKSQVSKEFQEMKISLDEKNFSHLSITKETPINHTGLSIRALNALGIISRKFEGTNGLKWDLSKCEVTVGHFAGLKKSDLYGIRNVGKKTLTEIENCLFQAGIVIVK